MSNISAFLAAVTAACVLSSPVIAAEVVNPAQLEAARTPADHEAIAQAYDAAAQAAENDAASHVKMASIYSAGVHKAPAASMASHCKSLADYYRKVAAEYRALAAEHREIARQAGK